MLGTSLTLDVMASLARSGINDARPIAMDIVAQSRCGNASDCINTFDRWLRNHFVYRGEQEEVLRTVSFMANDLKTKGTMEGDCDDMTIMSCAMFLSVGIQPRMTAIKSHPEEYDHVFCEALDEKGNWIPVDPTVPYGTPYHYFGIAYQAV